MIGSASGFRLASGSTFTASVTAVANGITYSNSTTFTTTPAELQITSVSGGVPANSSQVGSTVRVSFQAVDAIGISNAWTQVRNSAGNVIGTYNATLVSGSSTNGIYESFISTIIPDFSAGGTFAVEARVGGNGRIMWTWTPIGSFNLTPQTP